MAGPKTNGTGNGRDHEQAPSSKVASLDAARQAARAREKASQKLDRVPSTLRDRLLGGAFVLLALGMLSYWAAGLLKLMR